MSTRRTARKVALQSLYWVESADDPIEVALEDVAKKAKLTPDLRGFALRLCQGVLQNKAHFESLIKEIVEHWEFSRISKVDRIIMYIALAEILFFDDIPPKVSINEAIELAKDFGGERSWDFVNGILDAIVKKEELLKEE